MIGSYIAYACPLRIPANSLCSEQGKQSPVVHQGYSMAKVEIFTAQGCGYCVRALRLLESKKIAFEHTDVTLSSSLRAEVRSRSGGITSVPQIFIDDDHIGGCSELMQLDRLGHLDKLLQA